MPSMPHKTTVASSVRHSVECTSCGTRMAMTEAEMEDDNTVCANASCPTRIAYMDNDDEAIMDEDHKHGENDEEETKEAANTDLTLMNQNVNIHLTYN